MSESALKDLVKLGKELALEIPRTISFKLQQKSIELSHILDDALGDGPPSTYSAWVSEHDGKSTRLELEGVLNCRVHRPKWIDEGSFGMLESLIEGSFGLAVDESILNALRVRILDHLITRFRDRKYRTCVWDLPEFNQFVTGRRGSLIFDMRKLVKEWRLTLGTNERPMSRPLIELVCSAFQFQLGVVSLTSTRDIYLEVYGLYGLPRVYIGFDGAGRSYFILSKGEGFISLLFNLIIL